MQYFFIDESGATAIEYGLIAALVAVGIIGATTGLQESISGTFGDISTELDNAADSGDSGDGGDGS